MDMGRRGVLLRVFLLVSLVLAVSIAPISPLSPVANASGTVHIVRWGETLTSIAARYGVTVTALMQANHLRSVNYIYVGQRLVIPGATPPSTGTSYHIVRRGETLSSIASRYGVTVSALMAANGLRSPNFIWVGQRLRIPGHSGSTPSTPPSSGYYVVRPGDSLSSIAARYGTSVGALMRLNGLRSPNLIYVGQRLRVSGSASPTTPSHPSGGKWIDINLSRQVLTAYQGNTPVFAATVSTGVAAHPTVTGRFAIYLKIPIQRMVGPGYNLPNVPWDMYFYTNYAIHGAYWHNNFGHPMSHGCVNMRIPEAKWLYQWAPIGTPVIIHY
jgi:LysM repeat protein